MQKVLNGSESLLSLYFLCINSCVFLEVLELQYLLIINVLKSIFLNAKLTLLTNCTSNLNIGMFVVAAIADLMQVQI